MSRQLPFSPAEFKAIYSQVPRLCVDIVIVTSNAVLLTQRQHQSWQGMWHLPGGTVFYQETMEDAVKRVAREELDISVKICDLLGYIEYPSEMEARGFGWSVGMAFLCQTRNAIPEVSQDQEPVKLFESLPKATVPEQRKFLRKVLPDIFD